ncbi:MAG: DUF2442 domain-containing protein [Polyangiales bacterium]
MSTGHKIAAVRDVDSDRFRVRLRYEDGYEGEVDLASLFTHPKGLAAEVLRGAMFDKCFVESGALAWPNGLELCPDAIRQWIAEQRGSRVA